MAPERWHLSFAPAATLFLQQLTPSLLRNTIREADIRLKDTVLADLDRIYERFVININRRYA